MAAYPYDAACGRSGLPPETWDDQVAGETEKQQQARHNAAAAVCVTCPVMDKCYARRELGGGVRAGIPHPDKVPGWDLAESNSWLGWSTQNIELHGNEAGYARHVRNNTRPCYSCLRALAVAKQERNRAA